MAQLFCKDLEFGMCNGDRKWPAANWSVSGIWSSLMNLYTACELSKGASGRNFGEKHLNWNAYSTNTHTHIYIYIYIYVHRLITWYFDPDQSPLHPFSTMFHGCLFTSTFKEQLAQIRRTRLAPQQVVAKKKVAGTSGGSEAANQHGFYII